MTSPELAKFIPEKYHPQEDQVAHIKPQIAKLSTEDQWASSITRTPTLLVLLKSYSFTLFEVLLYTNILVVSSLKNKALN